MKALFLTKTGNIEELRNNMNIREVTTPGYSEDEVLIKISHSALNHRDLWITKGLYAGIKLPVVLGSDCSGKIESKGTNCKNYKEGDEVIINPGFHWGKNENTQCSDFKILGLPDDGTLQEYITVNKKNVYKKPMHLTPEQAAALPLAGLTAYRALFKRAKVTSTDSVLITGIGGGVSQMAMLFTVAMGCSVFITSGDDLKLAEAQKMGINNGVNYNSPGWEKEIVKLSDGIDVVIDGTGGDILNKCFDIVKPGGTVVNYGATLGNVPEFPVRKLFWKQINLLGSTMGSDADFAEMLDFVSRSKIQPAIKNVFDLENTVDAFIQMESKKQFGKIIIKIQK